MLSMSTQATGSIAAAGADQLGTGARSPGSVPYSTISMTSSARYGSVSPRAVTSTRTYGARTSRDPPSDAASAVSIITGRKCHEPVSHAALSSSSPDLARRSIHRTGCTSNRRRSPLLTVHPPRSTRAPRFDEAPTGLAVAVLGGVVRPLSRNRDHNRPFSVLFSKFGSKFGGKRPKRQQKSPSFEGLNH